MSSVAWLSIPKPSVGHGNFFYGAELRQPDTPRRGPLKRQLSGIAPDYVLEASAPQKTVADTHFHLWEKEGGGQAQRNTLRVQISLGWLEGGCAQPKVPEEEWWWRPALGYDHAAPSAQLKHEEMSHWIALPWDDVHKNQAPSYQQGTYTDENGKLRPRATGTPGEYRAAVKIATALEDSLLKIQFPWSVRGSASSDNAKVAGWWEGVHYDALSAMSTADPDVDFDYFTEWPW